MTATEQFIAYVNETETLLLETGMIVLPVRSAGAGSVPEHIMLRLMRERCKELGWHGIEVERWVGGTDGTVAGRVRIPEIVFRRGLGVELTLAKDSQLSTKAGDVTFTLYGLQGLTIDDWINGQDPRVTKVLIRKGR